MAKEPLCENLVIIIIRKAIMLDVLSEVVANEMEMKNVIILNELLHLHVIYHINEISIFSTGNISDILLKILWNLEFTHQNVNSIEYFHLNRN